MAKVTKREALTRAKAAADKRAMPAEPIGYRLALLETPWDPAMPADWEKPLRRAYADQLVKRGAANKPVHSGTPGYRNEALSRRLVSAPPEEFAAQDKLAAAAGLSWNAWARGKLKG